MSCPSEPGYPNCCYQVSPTTLNVCKTRGCRCNFRLLMMVGVSSETCWASHKCEIKFWYTVSSCWIFFVGYTMMHGSTNVKIHKLFPLSVFFLFQTIFGILALIQQWVLILGISFHSPFASVSFIYVADVTLNKSVANLLHVTWRNIHVFLYTRSTVKNQVFI
jgi:hypothetical protein